MSEHAPSPPPERPPLRRRADDRAIAGVCAAVGRHLGIDPIILRIAVVALAFAGGAGVLAYLAAWLLIPAEEGGVVRSPGRVASVAGAGVLALALLWALPGAWWPVDGPFPGPLPGLVLLGLAGGLVWLLAGDATTRDGDRVRRVGQALVVVALSGVLAVVAFWVTATGGAVAMAVVVISAGVALAAAALAGRGRWLVLPAFAVALGVAVPAAAGIDIEGGVGEHTYRPATLADVRDRYAWGAGELVVDLRDVDFGGRTKRIAIELGMGEARILVPPGTCVGGRARIGAGAAELLGRKRGGLDVDVLSEAPARAGSGRLVVDADVGVGEVVVDTDDWDDDDWGRWDRRWDVEPPRPVGATATGCA